VLRNTWKQQKRSFGNMKQNPVYHIVSSSILKNYNICFFLSHQQYLMHIYDEKWSMALKCAVSKRLLMMALSLLACFIYYFRKTLKCVLFSSQIFSMWTSHISVMNAALLHLCRSSNSLVIWSTHGVGMTCAHAFELRFS
jgi:hypothetical protein